MVSDFARRIATSKEFKLMPSASVIDFIDLERRKGNIGAGRDLNPECKDAGNQCCGLLSYDRLTILPTGLILPNIINNKLYIFCSMVRHKLVPAAVCYCH